MKPQTEKSNRGFTLLEILCVILLISVFSAMVYPAIHALRRTHKRSRAAGETAELALAAERFKARYGHWPLKTTDGDSDWVYLPDDERCATGNGEALEQKDLILALTGVHAYNPRNHLFLQPSDEQMDNGQWIDPWGEPYGLLVDGNADGAIEINIEHLQNGKSIQIATNLQCVAFSWGNIDGPPVYSYSTE